MKCPKCGFVGTDAEVCARCGVVFSKLAARKSQAVPSKRSPSPARPPRWSRGFKYTLALIAAAVGSLAAFLASLPPSPSAYGLLPVNARTVTAAAVERAEEIAAEHPDVAVLRDYVANAHLSLALRMSSERRFDEADRSLEDAESWGAPLGRVASYRAFVCWDRGLWEEASRWASRALELGSKVNPAEMHHIIGKAHYYREDLPRAIEELERARALRDTPSIRRSLDLAKRDARIAGSYQRLELAHFVLRFDASTMREPGRIAIDTLERSYQALVAEMGFEPRERVAVILYHRSQYLEVGGHHEATGLFDGKIRVSIEDIETNESWIRETLRHELAHAFVRSRTATRIPRWLNEGIAEYVVGARTSDLTRRITTPVPQGALERCVLDEACERATFYRAAASMVDYLVDFRGMEGIRDVLDDLARGTSIDASLRRLYGKDARGMAREWESYLRRQVARAPVPSSPFASARPPSHRAFDDRPRTFSRGAWRPAPASCVSSRVLPRLRRAPRPAPRGADVGASAMNRASVANRELGYSSRQRLL